MSPADGAQVKVRVTREELGTAVSVSVTAGEFHGGCSVCVLYMNRRGPRILREVARMAGKDVAAWSRIVERFVRGLHARHLAGLSIEVPA